MRDRLLDDLKFGRVPMETLPLPTGDGGIHATVQKMKKIIKESAANPYVRRWAELIVESVQQSDRRAEAEAVHAFVRDKVRYTRDPYGVEFIKTPPLLLQQIERGEIPHGDCDDKTVLGLSMLKSLGLPVALKVTSYRPDKRYSHVYGLVNVKGQWIPFDAVRRDLQLGDEAPVIPTRYFEMLVDDGLGDSPFSPDEHRTITALSALATVTLFAYTMFGLRKR